MVAVARSAAFESEVRDLAGRLAELGADQGSRVYRMSWWSDRLIAWAMAHSEFKTQLFRLVDVYPALRDDADVARHLGEYFDGVEVPRMLELGLDAAPHVPFGRRIETSVARRNILRMARQFIVGADVGEAVDGLHRLWRDGSAFTVDVLGEKTITAADADRYATRVDDLLAALIAAAPGWAPDPHLESDDLGPLPRVNLSVKPSALALHFEPLTRDEGIRSCRDRLRPILRRARDGGAFVHVDMEHDAAKDLTLEMFTSLLDEPEFTDVAAGIVIQAYRKDSYADLRDLIAWSSDRSRPITVRLVKGAYWDTETVLARQHGWGIPVFAHKAETDVNYERCVDLLHAHHGSVRAAFASHNLRSLAYAVTAARHAGIADHGIELQMLYGMAEPIHAAVKRLGLRLRVYAPMGDLVPGMAYLVRRLLENTSNESFVRHRFAEGAELEALVQPPDVSEIPDPDPPVRRPATDPARPGPFDDEPPAQFQLRPVRAAMSAAVHAFDSRGRDAVWAFGGKVPLLIDGRRIEDGDAGEITSVDPGRPDRIVAVAASAGLDQADAAVGGALAAQPAWAARPAAERAAVLFRAAEWMRARRWTIAALEMAEAGKPWAEADGDVCEAIDFCEYYGREMLRLDAGGPVISPPGETNALRYRAKGVAVVIPPWNFPLAIPTGMVAAALVAGNAVVLKPAEQTPAVAWMLVEALRAGGVPDGVLQLVNGLGETVGAHLVRHPDVAVIAFTGSMAVGLDIVAAAAQVVPGQRHVKRVIAEMGGKNALIIDHDADLDQAIPAAVYSAFGYSGQKCSAASRLIVHDAVYEAALERLVGVTRELIIGQGCQPSTQLGPLIEPSAVERVQRYRDAVAAGDGRVVLARDDVPEAGWFAGPVIVDEVAPSAPVACEEIFGPLLTVFQAGSFDEALGLANDTPFALTAGLFSRSPVHLERAGRELRAGNIYLNRTITGAVVGRQPFGGHGLSGVGSKAGGPDYLLQLLDPVTITENTLRQGFAPDPSS